jgi:hypothetical protein
MKILIKEEQFNNLIPPVVRRRMTERDFGILDDIIDTNKRYGVALDFDMYLDGNLRDSLNEFIHDYKAEEIDPNLDNDDWDDEENTKYKIFWELIPFLKKKYYNELYDYYMENHIRRGNMNESKENLYDLIPPKVKRRLEPGDLDELELIIDKKYSLRGYYLSGDFENYLNSVISDSIDSFVVNNKSDAYVIGSNLDNYMDRRRKVILIFKGLIPFLKEKYRDKLYQFYSDL